MLLERRRQAVLRSRSPEPSSSSLVSTKEEQHLLQELSQARAQHKAQVEQLHWSYKELKKMLGLFPRGGC